MGDKMGEFVKVCGKDDIKPGQGKGFDVNGKRIAIFNINGSFYSISAVCPHAGGPLDEGGVDNFELECPWHGAKFDVRGGKVLGPPATEDVERFEIKVEGNDVFVKV